MKPRKEYQDIFNSVKASSGFSTVRGAHKAIEVAVECCQLQTYPVQL